MNLRMLLIHRFRLIFHEMSVQISESLGQIMYLAILKGYCPRKWALQDILVFKMNLSEILRIAWMNHIAPKN